MWCSWFLFSLSAFYWFFNRSFLLPFFSSPLAADAKLLYSASQREATRRAGKCEKRDFYTVSCYLCFMFAAAAHFYIFVFYYHSQFLNNGRVHQIIANEIYLEFWIFISDFTLKKIKTRKNCSRQMQCKMHHITWTWNRCIFFWSHEICDDFSPSPYTHFFISHFHFQRLIFFSIIFFFL